MFFVSVLSFSQNKTHKYNLENYIKVVEENNLQIKISKNQLDFSQLSKKEALSALLPQINFQGNVKHNFSDQYMYLELPDYDNIDLTTGEIPSRLQKFKSGFENDFQAHLILEQNLFVLKNIYDLKVSQIYSEIGTLEHKEKTNEIISKAKKAFIQTRLMQEVFELNKVSKKNAEENYLDAKNKFENKLISELEMLQAKLRWENEIPKIKQAKRNYLILLANLKIIAGINYKDSMIIEHNLSSYEFNSKNINEKEAINKRNDYKMLEKNYELQNEIIYKEKSEYLPTISSQLGYSYLSNSDKWDLDENKNKYFYAGITLTIPIFSGGYRNTQLSKAKINFNNAKLNKQEAELSMAIEIQNLQMKMSEEYKIILAAESTVKTDQKAYKLANENISTGLISQIDLKIISEDLKKAQINLYYSVYNY